MSQVKNIKDLLAAVDRSTPEDFQKAMVAILQNQQSILSVCKEQWLESLQLALAILNRNPSYLAYLDITTQSDNKKSVFALKIISQLRDLEYLEQKFDRLIDFIRIYTEPQCQFIILRQLQLLLERGVSTDFSVFLPLVLRSIALILQQYINSKKGKASGSQDKLDHEICLETYCEGWVRDLLINLNDTIIKNPQSLRYFLNYSMDAVQALLRNLLESAFRQDILTAILSNFQKHILNNYSFPFLADLQNQLLRLTNFSFQERLFEVPPKYQSTMPLNSSGLTYMYSKFLQQKGCQIMYSEKRLLKNLMQAVGEAVRQPFAHKFYLLEKLAKYNLKVDSNNQCDYPVSVLVNNILLGQPTHPSSKTVLDKISVSPSIASIFLKGKGEHTIQWLIGKVNKDHDWKPVLEKLKRLPIKKQLSEQIDKILYN